MLKTVSTLVALKVYHSSQFVFMMTFSGWPLSRPHEIPWLFQ